MRDPDADLVDAAADWLRRHSGYDVAAIVPNGRQLVRDVLLATG